MYYYGLLQIEDACPQYFTCSLSFVSFCHRPTFYPGPQQPQSTTQPPNCSLFSRFLSLPLHLADLLQTNLSLVLIMPSFLLTNQWFPIVYCVASKLLLALKALHNQAQYDL